VKGGIQAGYLQYAIINTAKEKGIVIHVIIYRIITKIYFSKALFEGLIFGGAYIRRGIYTKGNLRDKIG